MRIKRYVCIFTCAMFLLGCSFATDDFERKEIHKAEVVSVVDGDTIKIRFPDTDSVPIGCSVQETVRLIGINTPELFTTPPEFFSNDARLFTNMLYRQKIYLEFDDNGSRDVYGRLLTYIRLDNLQKWQYAFAAFDVDTSLISSPLNGNTFLFNEAILLAGYAYYYDKYAFDEGYMNSFESAEDMAQVHKIGLWK